MKRLGITIMIALAAGPLVAATAEGKPRKHARAATTFQTFDIAAHYIEGPGTVDGVDCRRSRVAEPWSVCRVHYPIDSTFDGGGIVGEAQADVVGWPEPPTRRFRYEGWQLVTGTVEHCGAGSFIMEVPFGYVDLATFNPATQSADGFNTWFIRPGSGTGALEGISGGGINIWTTRPLEQNPEDKRFGEGVFSGKVTCRVPRGRRAG